ncbi:LppP/LprE family lipoprotein [Alicyclobacillus mengziensis]|uniref:LppP/LprE family lipoprotein n=1 Tax=Alicyclobacillus mengziensis TaxID=2931921 RepID=A0A9X7W174_9BACL|nr:LppP/LprE family lipoprotein [Alicyclobacillus mengziensis]
MKTCRSSKTAIQSIQADGVRKFTVTYANYKPTDAMMSPSLLPQTVTYSWSGTSFVASAPLAPGVKSGNVQVTHSW